MPAPSERKIAAAIAVAGDWALNAPLREVMIFATARGIFVANDSFEEFLQRVIDARAKVILQSSLFKD